MEHESPRGAGGEGREPRVQKGDGQDEALGCSRDDQDRRLRWQAVGMAFI